MSHVAGILESYSSLNDGNLVAYYNKPRIRKFLTNSGLVTREGKIVTEQTYRSNLQQTEHERYVRDVVARAIVHKSLDMERSRQLAIRKKMEEIAKLEQVRRVRADRDKNKLGPLALSEAGKAKSAANGKKLARRKNQKQNGLKSDSTDKFITEESMMHYPKPSAGRDDADALSESESSSESEHRSPKPRAVKSAPPLKSEKGDGRRSGKQRENEADDVGEGEGEDEDDGSVSHVSIDTHHLVTLDQPALIRYGRKLDKHFGRDQSPRNPYLSNVKLPDYLLDKRIARDRSPKNPYLSQAKSPRSPRTSGSQSRLPRGEEWKHSNVEICLRFHGLASDRRARGFSKQHEVQVDQQPCGGNTVTLFRKILEPESDFTLRSRRHKEFPFGLTFFVDGNRNCRISSCCEYKHREGRRIGTSNSPFTIIYVKGARPCFKCRERESQKSTKNTEDYDSQDEEEDKRKSRPLTTAVRSLRRSSRRGRKRRSPSSSSSSQASSENDELEGSLEDSDEPVNGDIQTELEAVASPSPVVEHFEIGIQTDTFAHMDVGTTRTPSQSPIMHDMSVSPEQITQQETSEGNISVAESTESESESDRSSSRASRTSGSHTRQSSNSRPATAARNTAVSDDPITARTDDLTTARTDDLTTARTDDLATARTDDQVDAKKSLHERSRRRRKSADINEDSEFYKRLQDANAVEVTSNADEFSNMAEWFEAEQQALETKPRLLFENVTFTEEQWHKIGAALAKNKNLQALTIRSCAMTDNNAASVFSQLCENGGNKTLEYVNLESNNISAQSTDKLVSLVDLMPALNTLVLRRNKLGHHGVEAIIAGVLRKFAELKAEIVKAREEPRSTILGVPERPASSMSKSSFFSSLSLSSVVSENEGDQVDYAAMTINEEEKEKLRAAFRLRRLDFSGCNLSDNGASCIVDLIKSGAFIEVLGLGEMTRVTEYGWRFISKALKAATAIRELSLSRCLLGDKLMNIIFDKGMIESKSLRFVDLTHNKLNQKKTSLKIMTWLKLNSKLLIEVKLGNSLSTSKIDAEVRRRRTEESVKAPNAVPSKTTTNEVDKGEAVKQREVPKIIEEPVGEGYEEHDQDFGEKEFSEWRKQFETQLTWIRLVNVNLGGKRFKELIETLAKGNSCESLQRLEFIQCKIDKGINGATDKLSSLKNLRSLSFAGCNVGNKLVIAVILSLQNSSASKFTNLDLSECGIKENGASSISKLLQSNVTLQVLKLSGNPAITDSGWKSIGNGIEKSAHLRELYIDRCNFTDEFLVTLCAHGLLKTRSLKLIDLQNNQLTDKASMNLTLLFKQLFDTTFLVVEGNRISEKMWEKVFRALE